DHLDLYGYIRTKVSEDKKYSFIDLQKTAEDSSKDALNYYKEKAKGGNKDPNQELNQIFIECLATCHCATLLKEELIGDPIDVRMFESCKWKLKEEGEIENNSKDSLINCYVRPEEEESWTVLEKEKSEEEKENLRKTHYELGIVKRFDFSSKLQRMSSISKDKNENNLRCFCKGSPEKVKDLCIESSLPNNFDELLTDYTSKGLRVLAMAYKEINKTVEEAQSITREEVESDLYFLGLILVQNKLKEPTAKTIETLNKADIKMAMATGDNILTAISVSRDCNLIPKDCTILNLEIENNSIVTKLVSKASEEKEDISSPTEGFNPVSIEAVETFSKDKENKKEKEKIGASVELEIMEDQSNDLKEKLDVQSSKTDKESTTDEEELDLPSIKLNKDFFSIRHRTQLNYIIGIRGEIFERLYKINKKYLEEDKKPKSLEAYHKIFKNLLHYGVVYARMSPENKAMLVESLHDEEVTVLMCGDGANDCGALKAADIGVSLSQEEASIAAHFTSKIADISCLIKLLREGKACLVTSLQTFKYMMIYSLVQFISVTFLMTKESYLNDYQFLATDVFIIFPLAFFLPRTGAYEILTHERPTDSLISFPIITSILLQTFISFSFQFGSWAFFAYRNGFEDECGSDEDDNVYACTENTIVYLVSNVQYITTAFAFSVSKPYKQPIYTNYLLLLFIIIAFAFSTEIILYPDPFSKDWLIIVDLAWEWKFWILGFTIVNFLLSVAAEWFLLPCLFDCYNGRHVSNIKARLTDSKYEPTLKEMIKATERYKQ
ncbi:MAG: HAD-IC family P-type ATPase, partial [archaeon]|nr:HAD-IC family P-type ATPase [archaeon]